MKSLRICAFILAAASLGASGVLAAQPMPAQPKGMDGGPIGDRGHGPGMGGHRLPFPPGVGLSEAQQDRVFAIMHAQAPQRREFEKSVRAAHEALRELVRSGQFDDAKASAQAQALGKATAAGALLRARTGAQLMALLTPAQREQVRMARAARPAHP